MKESPELRAELVDLHVLTVSLNKVPSGIKTGKSAAYAITAQERLGTVLVPIPVTGKTANPVTIHFG